MMEQMIDNNQVLSDQKREIQSLQTNINKEKVELSESKVNLGKEEKNIQGCDQECSDIKDRFHLLDVEKIIDERNFNIVRHSMVNICF